MKDINSSSLQTMKDKFDTIGETVARGLSASITKISKSLAESVVLGKDLAETFRKMGEQLLVNILSHFIEMTARMIIDLALNKKKTDELAEQNNLMRKNTSEMKKQAFLSLFTGGSGSGIPFMASGGAVAKGQPYMVGEQGAELFVPNQSGQIQQTARGGSNGGSTTVNFNINTVDARGFDELLTQSRGTITQLINQAVNERGAKSII